MATAQIFSPDRKFLRQARECGGDFNKCYQCATCVSACSLSNEQYAFPRRQMLLAQWGMKDELLADPSPWLCFYCGDCSKVCPRGANPAENMMSLRRYLTTQYDWTGISRLMYSSAVWEFGALALVAALVALLFTLPQNFGFGLLRHSTPQALTTVMLDKFAPVWMVHKADIALALLLAFLLLTNAFRMLTFLTRGRHIPLRVYVRQLRELVVQGAFQLRWKACNDSQAARNWLRHFVLVTGYVTMFTLVVVFLPWFQVEDSSFQWTSFLGYYATLVLLLTTVWILWDRAQKKSEMHRFSHLSDWLFPILLFLTALTGILVNIFRLADLPMATYVTYAIHLMIAVPMLVVEVPFGKWAHLAYRPLAIFLAGAIHEAETTSPAGAMLPGETKASNQVYSHPDLIIF